MIVPWKDKAHRPRTFAIALKQMMNIEGYSITNRTIVIAAGVDHMTVKDWLDGRCFPTENELRDLCGAFLLIKYSRIFVRERNQLQTIFQDIIEHDKKMRGRRG